jgi:hypothetical protein
MTSSYDRTVRAVMWMDAFLSVAMVVVCILAVPVVATVDIPAGVQLGVAVSAIVIAALLAAFGAITAALLSMRMRSGQYFLPPALRLPLPAAMRPEIAAATPTRASGSRS